MELTKHQLLHLKALLKDALEEGNKTAYEAAVAILKSGTWPKDVDAECPCLIHDALEKDAVTHEKLPCAPFEVKADG